MNDRESGQSAHSGEQSMKGAEIVVKCLERQGAEMIFAYPGGASMELHQALRNSDIRVVLPRNEQGGAFAAAGYARASGRIGVCMATSGPGATNLVTGIADAYMDSIPLVAITGQVPQSFIGKNAFQETDIIGVTRPIVKHSFLALAPGDLPEIFAEAFFLAGSGRPGPVVVDLPKDVQQAYCQPVFPDEPTLRAYSVAPEASASDAERIRQAVRESSRPCIYAGGGIIASGAHRQLREFAEGYNIPVVTSLMGIGAFPEDHPLALKWPGMHGTYYASYALNEADLVIGIGVRYDDRVTGDAETFAKNAVIVHVDIDSSEINKNKAADIGIVCDAGSILEKLNTDPIHKPYTAWLEQIAEWKREHPLEWRPEDGRILPQQVIETLHRLTDGKALIVTGVGQHQMWAAQFYRFERPRQLLTSGGLGTMGFGLPSAIGAKLACPDQDVVLIDGDGSFQMNVQELGTVHTEDVDVKMIVINNQHLGMVAQWEDRFYGSRRGETELSSSRADSPYPDFPMIAQGYLIPGRHVWKSDELESSLREMLDSSGAYLLDIHVDYQDHVLPMIPPGKTHREIILE